MTPGKKEEYNEPNHYCLSDSASDCRRGFLLEEEQGACYEYTGSHQRYPRRGSQDHPPFDPSFDKRIASFLKGPSSIVNRVKPFSVIVENTGRRAIVGSRLVWVIMKSDGTVYRHHIGAANPRAFLGGDKINQTTLGAAIPSHATRFVSLVGSVPEGEQVDLSTCELEFSGSPKDLEAFNQALQEGNREAAFDRSFIGQIIAQATDITVSIDGIFFEDGTFVGENQTGLYEEVKAYVDAEYDLISEISAAQKQGKSPSDIVKQVTSFVAANSRTESESPLIDKHGVKMEGRLPLTSLAATKPIADPYQRYKTMHARTFLGKTERLGVNEAIRDVLKLLKKPRIEMRRK
jgi:hypothetical protein